MDDPVNLGKVWLDGLDHYRSILFCSTYISAPNGDIDTKLSGYDPWVQPTTLRRSLMTLGTWESFGWVSISTIGLFSLFSLYLS